MSTTFSPPTSPHSSTFTPHPGYSQRTSTVTTTTNYHLSKDYSSHPGGYATQPDGTTPMLDRSRESSEKEADPSPVQLGPWEHHWLPLLGLIIAVFLQASLFGGSLYIWRNPIERPLGRYLLGKVTVKYFNFAVSVAGAVINGAAVFGLAVGARSYISRRLLGNGITLHGYDSLWAIGNGGIGRRISRYAILPIILYILSNLSASAVNAVWVVGNEQVSTPFTLSYVDVSSNQAYYTNKNVSGTQLYQPEDFEALAYSMADALNAGKNSTATNSVVDGLNMTIADGVVPSLRPISTLRQSIKGGSPVTGGQNVSLPRGRPAIISMATTNDYTVQAPVAVATSSCVSHWLLETQPAPSTLTLTPVSGNDTLFYYVDIRDTMCSTTAYTLRYAAGNGISGSSWGCFLPSTGQVYTSYFMVWPAKKLATAIASCNSTVKAGVASFEYQDLTSTYNISGSPQLTTPVDVTESAWNLYFNWFSFPSLQNTGSPGLSYLVRANEISLGRFANGEPWANVFKTWSQAALAMGITKLVNTNTIYGTDPTWLAETGDYFTGYNNTDGTAAKMVLNVLPVQAKSDALVIGPTGYTALLIIVIGLMFVLLCGALGVAFAAPPVTLNPLDPVSVLLVAQNSPPSVGADGGCLGNVSQVRDENVPIQYRAVNNQHLAFVFGENYYEPPQFGRMYGRLSEKELSDKKEL
ncbi:hypothetical protein T439DRAFT_351287 [Meredithblackwellia eburnea MCA 4105]